MSEQVDADISRAEMLSLPAVFVLLVIIAGGALIVGAVWAD